MGRTSIKKVIKEQVEDENLDETEIIEVDVENEDDEIIEEIDESAADSLRPNSMPVGPANKAAAIAKVVDAMAGMDKETINKFVATINQIGHEADNIPGGAASKNAGTLSTKPSGAAVQLVTKLESLETSVGDLIKEDVAEIFVGEELTEEFKDKVSTLIESVINLKASQRLQSLEEEYDAKFEALMEETIDGFADQLNDYLDDAIVEWIEQNQVAVESSLRSDLTEDFIENLKALFETHYINVPEDKVDIVEEMSTRIDELEALISEQIEENKVLETSLEEAAAREALSEMTKGLTESEVEKLEELAESVEFANVDEFKKKVGVLKETYFRSEETNKESGPSVLFEETDKLEDELNERVLPHSMNKYVDILSRTSKR